MRCIWLCLGMIFFTGSALAASLPPDVQKVLYQADQCLRKKEFHKAETVLKKSLQTPVCQHPQIDFFLGNALLSQGKAKEAVGSYQKSLAKDDSCAPAWQNLAKAAHDSGQHSLCAKALMQSYALQGRKNKELLFSAASAYILDGKKRKALPILEKLVQSSKNPQQKWLNALLGLSVELGDERRAVKAVHGVLAKDKENPKWWKLLAQLHTKKRHYREALAAWEVYAGLVGKPPRKEVEFMGDLYFAAGVPAKAAVCYQNLLSQDGAVALWEKTASAYLAAHELKKAKDVAAKGLKRQASAKLWNVLGRAAFEQENYQEAFKAFGRSADLKAGDGRARLMQGYCALRLRQHDLAERALQKAVRHAAVRGEARALLQSIAPEGKG